MRVLDMFHTCPVPIFTTRVIGSLPVMRTSPRGDTDAISAAPIRAGTSPEQSSTVTTFHPSGVGVCAGAQEDPGEATVAPSFPLASENSVKAKQLSAINASQRNLLRAFII